MSDQLDINIHQRNATILSSGMYAPQNVVPNSYFDTLLGENVSTWLAENVQIYERRWCSADESTADLVEQACLKALQNGGFSPEQIDLLIIATDTPEYISPSTASVIQDRLKLVNAGTFDVNTACAGFVTALDIATKYIKSDSSYNHILVVGAYTMSKYLNKSDKKTVTLFADGAGAVVLGNTNEAKGCLASKLATKGEYNSWMGIYGGASANPTTTESLANHDTQLKFIHKIPTHINPEVWSSMILESCFKAGIDVNDIDHFFMTQININSIFLTMDKLGVDRSKAATIMHDYGYTGSACIPMAFDIWMQQGKVKSGDIVCFMGSGGGLAFGCSIFKM